MRILLSFFLLLLIQFVFAQSRNFRVVKSPSEKPTTQQRKAIVIGMSDYGQGRNLNNTLNDANDMSVALAELGFEVTLLKNNDLRNLKTNLTNWYSSIQNNDMAIFYFAGHGIEVNGENFLIPIEADLSSETDVVYNTLNVNSVLGNMDEKKVGMKLIILDACRDNPFKRSWTRSGGTSGGLAQISAPRGTYIAFAASPGFTAQDGGNFKLQNGVFTHYLKTEIVKKGVSIDEIFNNVSGAVSELTNYKQTPFKNSSLTKNFYFIPPSININNIPVNNQPQILTKEPFKKFYYYVDQSGKESTTHFDSREEVINYMKAKKKFGKAYSNAGEVFIVEDTFKEKDSKESNVKPKQSKSEASVNKFLTKVENLYTLNKLDDAKIELNQLVAESGGKGAIESKYWNAKILALNFKDPTIRSKTPSIITEAEIAMNEYIQSDPNFEMVKTKGSELFTNMYNTLTEIGVSNFNINNYELAASSFEKAIFYSDYILRNKWSMREETIDTTIILNCAISYRYAKKPDFAAKYYSRLADIKVNGPEFIDVYKFLLEHHTKNKNKIEFDLYYNYAKALYPKIVWDDYEVKYMDQNFNLSEKTSYYDEMDKSGKLSEHLYMQFANIFGAVKNENGIDSITRIKYNQKSTEAYQNAFNKNNTNGIAAFNAGSNYYNHFNEGETKFSSNNNLLKELLLVKPIKDLKRKAELEQINKLKILELKNQNAEIEKTVMNHADSALDWFSKSYNTLAFKKNRTFAERNILNKAVDFIANLYYYKKERVKLSDPTLYKLLESKFNEFDSLHNTFK